MKFKFTIKPDQQLIAERGLEIGGETQEFVDSEVIRYNKPYIPFDTGMLTQSGTLHTVIGSGKVVYKTPYGRFQYYATAESRSYDAMRGGMWFERMKADHKGDILRGARQISGAQGG